MRDGAAFRVVRLGWDGQRVSLDYSIDISTEKYPSFAHIARGIRNLRFPITALADVEMQPALPREDGYIRLVPRQGASALHTAASPHLHPSIDPLGFNFARRQERKAERYVQELRKAILGHGLADTPVDKFVIHYPERITNCVGHDGSMHLNNEILTISWASFADHRKRSQGPHLRLSIAALESVTWRPGNSTADGYGYLQLHLAGAPPESEAHPAEDINAILLDTGESYATGALIAATLLQRMQRTDTCPDSSLLQVRTRLYSPNRTDQCRQDRDDPFERLHRLGELRDAGVLTEDDFQTKKKEILDRL